MYIYDMLRHNIILDGWEHFFKVKLSLLDIYRGSDGGPYCGQERGPYNARQL